MHLLSYALMFPGGESIMNEVERTMDEHNVERIQFNLKPGERVALNVGCGPTYKKDTHYLIMGEEWIHCRVDIDSSVEPDVIDDSATLMKFGPKSVDAIYTSHNLEHLHEFDAKLALRNYYEKLKDPGLLIVVVPNLQAACEMIAKGNYGPAYLSPAGPVRAIDMLYGYTPYTHENVYQRHLYGYTGDMLYSVLIEAGFKDVQVTPDNLFNLYAFAQKYS